MIASVAAEGSHRGARPANLSDEEIAWRAREDAQDGELFRLAAYTGLRLGELRDAVPTFWGPQNPAEGRKFIRYEVGRGHSVRRNHEFLDQLRRPVLRIQIEIGNRVAGEDHLRLDRFEAERAVGVAQVHEPLCDPVLEAEVFGESRNLEDSRGSCGFAIQPCRDA